MKFSKFSVIFYLQIHKNTTQIRPSISRKSNIYHNFLYCRRLALGAEYFEKSLLKFALQINKKKHFPNKSKQYFQTQNFTYYFNLFVNSTVDSFLTFIIHTSLYIHCLWSLPMDTAQWTTVFTDIIKYIHKEINKEIYFTTIWFQINNLLC